MNEDVKIENELLGVDAENSEEKEAIKMISIMVVYMVLIFVLSRITNEIAIEKVSKSIEYVLTSVSEKEYLLAKVLSSTLTVFIQILYTFVYYMIGNLISSIIASNVSGSDIVNSFAVIDTSIISYILVMCGYLVFTVFLTTLIQAALASKTTSVAEAGNTLMFLMFVVIALYFVSIGAISPYTKVTPFMYIISCLPIVSTFFVPSMMIIGQATGIQIFISFVLLIASVPFIFNICAKIFKNGVLDYTSTKKKRRLFAKQTKNELNIKEQQNYELRKSKARKFAFTIGMAMIISIFLQVVASFVLGIILPKIVSDNTNPDTLFIILNSLTIIISLWLSAKFINFYLENDSIKAKKLTGKEKFEIIFMGISFLTVVQFLLNIIYPKIGLDYSIFDEMGIGPGKGFGSKLLYIIGIAAVPAIFEELLFRKAVLNASRRFGAGFAVVFSALLFGLYHFNINQGIFAFLIGILFGIIAIKTNSIKLTVVLHFLNNLYACIATIIHQNNIAYTMLNNIIIAIAVVGGMIMLKNLPELRKIKKEDLIINKDCQFLLQNYTFIISIILMVVMFIATENIISY